MRFDAHGASWVRRGDGAGGMGDASEGSASRVFLCTKSRETDAFGREPDRRRCVMTARRVTASTRAV